MGGPARIVADLMDDLDPERFEQRLLTGRVGRRRGRRARAAAPHIPARRIDGLGRAPNPLADPQALARVISEIRPFRPHIVETHTAKAGVIGRLAAFATRSRDQPRVPRPSPARLLLADGHASRGHHRTGARVADDEHRCGRRTRARRAARRSHRTSKPVHGDLAGRRHHRAARPGCCPQRLGLPASGAVVAFVGRLAEVKRPDRFVRVATRVAATRADVRFVVAGDGDGLDDMRARPTQRLRCRDGSPCSGGGPTSRRSTRRATSCC